MTTGNGAGGTPAGSGQPAGAGTVTDGGKGGAPAGDAAAAAAAAAAGTAVAAAGAGDGKGTTGQPGSSGAPAEIKLELPKDAKIGKESLEKIVASARELGLSQENATKLLELVNGQVAGYVESSAASLVEMKGKWAEQCVADPEIGGERFDANAALCAAVTAKFGNDAFKKVMNQSGLGNHPEIVRFIVKIGQAMKEDGLITTGEESGNKNRDTADILYGAKPT